MKKVLGSAVVGLLLVTVLAVGLIAGCGGTKTTPTGTTPLPSPSATSPTTPSSTPATSPSSGSTTLPRYEPSSLVSDAPGSLQLTSPNSVQKVTAFYDNAIAQGGWSIVSTSKTGASTNITAKRGSTGTTLSISTTGSGSYISLVTYPI